MPRSPEDPNELVARGIEFEDDGDLLRAASCYREAAGLDPTYSAPLFNLGLIAKSTGDWEGCAAHNLAAIERDTTNRAAWWNLGIAATALGDWSLARRAWRGFGLDVPNGDGPIDLPCGFGPVRLDPGGSGEVVWGVRLDPARMRIESIPFPQSGFRFGDIVLNDGAPNGTRSLNGRDVPVYDAIALLVRSEHETFLVDMRCPDGVDIRRTLEETARGARGSAEDWSHSVRFICRACSEGVPDPTHPHARPDVADVRTLAIAATGDAHARAICDALIAAVPALSVLGIRRSES